MNADEVWQGIGANVVGAVIGGLVAILSALWVVGRTNRGAERHARQQRLEAAVGELILAVTALYDPRRLTSTTAVDEAEQKWLPRFDQARVQVLLLTGSDDLDAQLQEMGDSWRRPWWTLLEYALDMAENLLESWPGGPVPDELQPPEGMQFYREAKRLEAMPADLVRRLRGLEAPTPEHARKLTNSLGQWREKLGELEQKYGTAPEIHWYKVRGIQAPPWLE